MGKAIVLDSSKEVKKKTKIKKIKKEANRKIEKAERQIEEQKKGKKVFKRNPGAVKERVRQTTEEELNRIREQWKVNKGYDYLTDDELIILDGVMTNRDKRELAEELGMGLSGVYYKISTPVFQKAFQKEMKEKYEVMKKARKALYVKIAEKSLNILLTHLDYVEKEQEKNGFSYEKMRDVMTIIEKVINLMQEEEGTKTTNMNISGEMTNTNLNADSNTMKEFNLADNEFRNHLAKALVASKPKAPLI